MYGCVNEIIGYFCVYVWFNWFGWRWFDLLIGRVGSCDVCYIKFG